MERACFARQWADVGGEGAQGVSACVSPKASVRGILVVPSSREQSVGRHRTTLETLGMELAACIARRFFFPLPWPGEHFTSVLRHAVALRHRCLLCARAASVWWSTSSLANGGYCCCYNTLINQINVDLKTGCKPSRKQSHHHATMGSQKFRINS